MPPLSLRLMGRKVIATALAVALVLSGSGPIYAQEIRVVTGQGSASGVAGQAGALTLPNVLSPLSPSMLNASLAPSLSVLAAPSLTPSAVAFGGHARTGNPREPRSAHHPVRHPGGGCAHHRG
ncbi:MAG: hypothetical protein ABL955_10715, partial [Elusimicrobiota bacterium]